MEPEHLREDLKQELFLILCEKSESFIEDLHKKGQLRYYTTRIVLNMIASNTSPFYKKYRQIFSQHSDALHEIADKLSNAGETDLLKPLIANGQLSDDDGAVQRETDYINMVNAVNAAIEKLPHYDREIFKDYVDKGSAGKMIKEMVALTGSYIPKRSILATVKSVKKFIKEEVKKNV